MATITNKHLPQRIDSEASSVVKPSGDAPILAAAPDMETGRERRKSIALGTVAAHYGVLPTDTSVHKFVAARLHTLLKGIPTSEQPEVRILARRGYGINAGATDDGNIFVTPELLSFIKTVEELDFVLLHEVIHIAHGHHAAQRKLQDTLLPKLGIDRVSEYDADLHAFVLLANPDRGSSPLGAIVCLERFRDHCPTSWDFAHGSVTDRILNLKTFSLLGDLSEGAPVPGDFGSLTKKLRSLPSVIADHLTGLPTGSRIDALLKNPPPEGHKFDAYRKQLLAAIGDSSAPSLRTAIPAISSELKKTDGFAAMQADIRDLSSLTVTHRLEAYREVLMLAYERLFSIASDTAQENRITPVESEVLLGIELVLAGQSPEDLERCLPNSKVPSRVAGALNTLRTFATSAEDVARLGEIVKEYVDAPTTLSFARTLFLAVVPAAVGNNCAFDDEAERVDTARYFESVGSFASALCGIVHDSALTRDELREEFEALSVFTLAAHLADVKSTQLASLSSEALSGLSDLTSRKGSLSSALSSVVSIQSSDDVVAALNKFVTDEMGVLSLEKTQETLVSLFSEANRIIEQPEGNVPAALDQIEQLYKEAARVAKNLPSHVPERAVPGLDSRAGTGTMSAYRVMLHLMSYDPSHGARGDPPRSNAAALLRKEQLTDRLDFSESVRLAALKVGLLSTVCANNFERDDAISCTESLVKSDLADFEEIASAIELLHSERPEVLMRGEPVARRSLKPAADLRLQNHAAAALLVELNQLGGGKEAHKLDRIYTFVQRCFVCESEDQRDDGLFNSILAHGEGALREVYKDSRSSPDFLRHSIAVSFFVGDPVLGRSIQRELLLRLVTEAGAASAAQEIFSTLRHQQSHLNLEILKALDEGASRADEVRAIGKQSREHLFSGFNEDAMGRAGKAVLGDFGVSKLVRRNFQEVLTMGLETRENDERLRDSIANQWWDAYGEDLLKPLIFSNPFEANRLLYRTGLQHGIAELEKMVPANLSDEVPGELRAVTAQGIRQGLYGLGLGERLFILRKLTSEPKKGVLISPERRVDVADLLLEKVMDSSSNDHLAALSSKAFGALFRSVDCDDLALALTPMLLDRFLRPPVSPSPWRPFADQKAALFISDSFRGRVPRGCRQDLESLEEAVANHIEWAMTGTNPRTNRSSLPALDGLIELSGVDFSPKATRPRVDSISFILDFSKNLQTPGTRALQLLGGIIQLPKDIEDTFLQVYDEREGQSKASALATIDRVLPDYGKRLQTIQRIGGGALYSVFLVGLDGSEKEVVRVINPNPEYHTQRILRSMRAAQQQLAREDSRFEIGEQLINLVDEWISAELKDESYEKDDAAFRTRWNGWKPAWRCPLSIYVPENYPSGTLVVRREEFIQGRNFTDLGALVSSDPKLAKQVVALAAQHYVAQLTGSMTEYMLGSELLVHSDISPGNLRIMDGGKVAILDRSMFLKFSLSDRKLLDSIAKAKTPKERAVAIVKGLAELQESKPPEDRVRAIESNVISALGGESSLEGTMLKGLLAAQREGLKVPLRFQLLVKNLNSLRVMAEKVGFKGLREALDFTWS